MKMLALLVLVLGFSSSVFAANEEFDKVFDQQVPGKTSCFFELESVGGSLNISAICDSEPLQTQYGSKSFRLGYRWINDLNNKLMSTHYSKKFIDAGFTPVSCNTSRVDGDLFTDCWFYRK